MIYRKLVPVPMNRGLAFNAVLTILLDDRFPVTGLALLDDRRAVAVAVPVVIPVPFADSYASADRPGKATPRSLSCSRPARDIAARRANVRSNRRTRLANRNPAKAAAATVGRK